MDKKPKKEAPCQKCQEYLTGWQRCLADFENYKKEEAGRREKTKWQSKAEVCFALIEALENFQRMNKCLPQDICNNEWVKGVLMVENQLISALKEIGLEEIKALNEEFNPEFHEAVGLAEGAGDKETVAEVIEKGWLLDNKVLKPAKVKVIK